MVYILCIYVYIHRYIYMSMFTLLPSVFIGFRNSQLQGLHIPTSLGDATACGWKLIWINRPMTGGWNLIRMCHGQLSYTGFNSRIVISYMVISYCHVSVISYCHVSPRYRADRVFYHITYPISTNLRLSHASVAGYKMSAKQINDYPSHSIAISFASITFASYHSTLLNSPATFAKCRQSLIKEVTGLLWELLLVFQISWN